MRVVLFSNASKSNFPDNSLTSFTVQLPADVDLSIGQWECGLAEIQFHKSWFNVTGAYINLSKASNVIRVPIPDGYYDGNNLEARLNETIQSYDGLVDETPHVSFQFDSITRRFSIQFTTGWYEAIDMEPKLAQSLGFSSQQKMDFANLARVQPLPPGVEPNRKLYTSVTSENTSVLIPVHAVMVYCDILGSSIVGDIAAPLLRSIPVKGDHWSIQTSSFHRIQFCPVSRKNIRSISVYLRSHLGERIQFTAGGLTVVTLEFRRIKSLHTY